jgi:hypothetical protein
MGMLYPLLPAEITRTMQFAECDEEYPDNNTPWPSNDGKVSLPRSSHF